MIVSSSIEVEWTVAYAALLGSSNRGTSRTHRVIRSYEIKNPISKRAKKKCIGGLNKRTWPMVLASKTRLSPKKIQRDKKRMSVSKKMRNEKVDLKEGRRKKRGIPVQLLADSWGPYDCKKRISITLDNGPSVEITNPAS